MQTAVAYIRVSGKRQVLGTSLSVQRKAVLTHALGKGYKLDRIFVEKGESAKSADRTKFKEMIAYCRANRRNVQVLLAPKVDRLARYVHDYSNVREQLKQWDIRFESIGESFDDSPAGRLQEHMLAAIAQFDNEIRTERCTSGQREAVADEGRYMWKAPPGYRNIRLSKRKGNIAPDPKTKDVVVRFFEKLAMGHDSLKTARLWLAENDIVLSPASVHRMVYNKAYIGIIDAFGKQHRAKPPFVPLIDERVFYLAQKAIERKMRVPRKYDRSNASFPLRGSLICGCGKAYTGCWSKGKGGRYPYYRCTACKRINLRRELVERAFMRELNSFRPRAAMMPRLGSQLLVAWKRQQSNAIEGRQRIQSQTSELRDLQKAISLKNARGITPDDIAREQIEDLNQQIAEILAETDAREAISTSAEFDHILAGAVEFLSSMGRRWLEATPEFRKKLLAFLYPNGFVYTKTDGFRTRDYPLLELVKDLFRGGQSLLVEQTEEITNQLDSIIEFFEGVADLKKAEKIDR